MAEHEQRKTNGSEQQAFIAELSQIASASSSRAALFDITVHRIRKILKADFCEVLKYDPQSQKFLLRAGAGWKRGLIGKIHLDAGVEWLTGYTLSSDGPVVVDDFNLESRFHQPPLLVEHGVLSGISVILHGHEQTYGVLSVHSRKSQNFSLDDAYFMQSAANILAGFIQHSSIETELRNQNINIENRLQIQDELLENVLAQSQIIVWSINRQGELCLSRRGGLAALGIPSGDKLGENVFEILPQDHPLRKYLNQALEGRAVDIDFKVDERIYDLQILPQVNQHGEITGVNGIAFDITSRREAEQALQDSETRFRSIFEFGAMGIALLDLHGNFLLTNPSLQKMLRFQEQELLSQSLRSLSYPFDTILLMELYAEIAAAKNNLFRQESRFQRKDKQIVWVSLTFSLVGNAGDAPAFVIGLFEDITYRKRMEAELREVKRQLIISEEKQRLYLAQELHDDPMQELYGVLFQLETLDLETEQNSGLQDELQVQLKLTKDMIEQIIQKLRVMCGQLRPINLAPFGLEGAIREHIDKFKEEHPNLIVKLDLSYDGQLLSDEVRISLFRIYQQAMGNIIRHAQANRIVVRFFYDHHKASLEVEDDGVGFEVPPRLFMLTRQDHLGIAGAAERAELLGGRLTIRSAPGKGTLVRAVVPLKPFEDPAMRESS